MALISGRGIVPLLLDPEKADKKVVLHPVSANHLAAVIWLYGGHRQVALCCGIYRWLLVVFIPWTVSGWTSEVRKNKKENLHTVSSRSLVVLSLLCWMGQKSRYMKVVLWVSWFCGLPWTQTMLVQSEALLIWAYNWLVITASLGFCLGARGDLGRSSFKVQVIGALPSLWKFATCLHSDGTWKACSDSAPPLGSLYTVFSTDGRSMCI